MNQGTGRISQVLRLVSISCEILLFIIFWGCGSEKSTQQEIIKPRLVTSAVPHDSDDPAIWVNPRDPSRSLIIGTDKHENGALVVFNLEGKIIKQIPHSRPNNVDIEYGLILNSEPIDIVVATERLTSKIRVFQLPEMTPVDNGGIRVFVGESQERQSPMGIALYKPPGSNVVYAIISRKTGPVQGYLWQYRLEDDGTGCVKGTKVRAFGTWSGKKEIEAVAVDDELGYVYYSDENVGIRKYYANPDAPDARLQLALLADDHYREDREGISIYRINDGTGYILVSDQDAGTFHVYTREGSPGNAHDHRLIKIVHLSTLESDGSEVTNSVLNPLFPAGLFVAMSADKTFHYYSWPDIAGNNLVIAPNGIASPKGRYK
jgi:3-phytase